MPDVNASLKRAIDGVGPQHKKQGFTEFEFSEGSNGALHTKVTDANGAPIDPRKVSDASALAELQAIKQQNSDILAKLNGTVNTQLTGRNVEEIVFFNATVTTTTAGVLSPTIDLSKFKDVYFEIYHSFDQNPALLMFTDIGKVWYFNESGIDTEFKITVPGGRKLLNLNTYYPWLNNANFKNVYFYFSCAVAPTTGSLTLVAKGVPN